MNNKGMTLVELLVALAIFATVLSITTGLVLALKTKQGDALEDASYTRQARLILERVSADLRGIPAKTTGRYDFEGSEKSLTFTTTTRMGSTKGAHKLKYRITKEDEKLSLALYDGNDQPLIKKIPLKMHDLSFHFYDGTKWLKNWAKEVPFPPESIKISTQKSRDGENIEMIVGLLK